jgi:hypothetical protein
MSKNRVKVGGTKKNGFFVLLDGKKASKKFDRRRDAKKAREKLLEGKLS